MTLRRSVPHRRVPDRGTADRWPRGIDDSRTPQDRRNSYRISTPARKPPAFQGIPPGILSCPPAVLSLFHRPAHKRAGRGRSHNPVTSLRHTFRQAENPPLTTNKPFEICRELRHLDGVSGEATRFSGRFKKQAGLQTQIAQASVRCRNLPIRAGRWGFVRRSVKQTTGAARGR